VSSGADGLHSVELGERAGRRPSVRVVAEPLAPRVAPVRVKARADGHEIRAEGLEPVADALRGPLGDAHQRTTEATR